MVVKNDRNQATLGKNHFQEMYESLNTIMY